MELQCAMNKSVFSKHRGRVDIKVFQPNNRLKKLFYLFIYLLSSLGLEHSRFTFSDRHRGGDKKKIAQH